MSADEIAGFYRNIADYLKSFQRPVVDRLQPGLLDEEIQNQTEPLPFVLPEEVVALYRCANGTRTQKGDMLGNLYFFPGFYFLSLEDACARYKAMQSAEDWKKNWFPVFANGGGDFYAAVCSTEASQTAEIIGYLQGETDQPVEFLSLTRLLECLDRCFREGVFWVNRAGQLDTNDGKQEAIAKELNPGLKVYEE